MRRLELTIQVQRLPRRTPYSQRDRMGKTDLFHTGVWIRIVCWDHRWMHAASHCLTHATEMVLMIKQRRDLPWWTSLKERSVILHCRVWSTSIFLPVQDHDSFDRRYLLCYSGGNSAIIKEAESHMFVGFCMMTRGSYNSKRLLQFSPCNGKTCLNHTPTTETSGTGSTFHDVQRHRFIIRFRIHDFLLCHIWTAVKRYLSKLLYFHLACVK